MKQSFGWTETGETVLNGMSKNWGSMVHTRHSRDVEVDSPPRFLSLEDKRSRKSRSHAADVDVSVNSNFFFTNKSRRWRLMADFSTVGQQVLTMLLTGKCQKKNTEVVFVEVVLVISREALWLSLQLFCQIALYIILVTIFSLWLVGLDLTHRVLKCFYEKYFRTQHISDTVDEADLMFVTF